VGLVVDDAIVVVENVQRQLQEGARDLKKATMKALTEVRGPIIATTVSLMAVFIPVAFLPGMTGQLYNQFALTVAFAVFLSGINSLTLSPALSAAILRPESGTKNAFFRAFNHLYEKIAKGYARSVKRLSGIWYMVLLAFIALCAVTVFLFMSIPTAFVPEEDQGYFVVTVQLPNAATSERTDEVMDKVNKILLDDPGIDETVVVTGYDIITGIEVPYVGFAFPVLKPWSERKTRELQLPSIIRRLQARFNEIQEAEVFATNAPAIPGLGEIGGFQFEIQDLNAQGIQALSDITDEFIARAEKRPELMNLFTTFSMQVPQRYIELDRVKAKTRKVLIEDINKTLQTNLGSLYVNEFNKFGRVYKVYVQANKDARSDERDISRLKVRNSEGEMIDLSALVRIKPLSGPYNIQHYDEYASVQVNGIPAAGYSSGQAIKAMEEVAKEVLVPRGFGYQWTAITYQQLKAGNLAPIVFALSLVFVFLVLAAQYESWLLPFMVLMAVPLGLLGSVGALLMRRMALDVYGQIGLVMLIGLSAKNAILIVEFAKDRREKGAGILEAAMEAARIRLRPILMTAFAFILGVFPLVVATGAGAHARRSLGTTVVSGMMLSTVLIIMIPIFYYMGEKFRERRISRKR
jgi:hydrophobe/amphiphile efflux-1 (HAE1) family protein